MRADRPSATARLIAAATTAAAHWGLQPPPSAASVEVARLLLGTSWADRLLRLSVEWRGTRAVWRLVEQRVAPGFTQHLCRRKAWIEYACRKSMTQGYTRIVILGAGLDSLGVRLAADEPGVQVIELDHPATQRIKRTAPGFGRNRSLTLLPVDLAAQDAGALLADTACSNEDVPTVVVAEGLLMYLPAARVERLLDDMCGVTRGRLRLILTFMERCGAEPIGFRGRTSRIGIWLRSVNEPFRWGATRAEVGAMLAQRGTYVLEIADEAGLAARWPGSVLEGEVLILAERAPTA